MDLGELQVNKNNPDDFSDEAVWSRDNNNINDSLEVGFFSGWGKGDLSGGSNWTNGMVPYYTTDNGAHEYDEWGTYLTANKYITMYAQATSSGSFAYVDGELNTSVNYVVDQPRQNYTQGEVWDNNAIWMGGGSVGDSSTLYWFSSDGSSANLWGSLSDCADAPYWVSSSEPYYFANGGT